MSFVLWVNWPMMHLVMAAPSQTAKNTEIRAGSRKVQADSNLHLPLSELSYWKNECHKLCDSALCDKCFDEMQNKGNAIGLVKQRKMR